MSAEAIPDLETFVQESRQRLSAAESDRLRLEEPGEATPVQELERLLQMVRAIRSGAASLELNPILAASQLLEILLNRMRDHTLSLQGESLSCLHVGMTTLRRLFEEPGLDLPVDEELEAIRSLLESPVPPLRFDLQRYPRAVADAVRHGLSLYILEIHLRGDGSAKKQQFDQLKGTLQGVGKLIASQPDLDSDFELGSYFQGKQVALLVATLMRKDRLAGVTQLPVELIESLPLPEPAPTETPLPRNDARVPSWQVEETPTLTFAPENLPETLITHARADTDTHAQAARERIEAQRQQAYFAELERQRRVREEHAREAEQKALLRAKQQKRLLLLSGAGCLVIGLILGLWLFDPGPAGKGQTLVAETPAPSSPPTEATPPPPPSRAVAGTTPPDAAPPADPVAPAAPTVAPDPPRTTTDTEPKLFVLQTETPATPEPTSAKPVAITPGGEPSLAFPGAFANRFSAMNRLLDSAYRTLTPPKNQPKGHLSFQRDPDGNVLFSMASLMHHTASRPGDAFTITPESISELRLIFQIDPNQAYMFEFDAEGRLTVPKAFWEPFARISRKAVTVSRVVGKGADGRHVRDLLAISIPSIVKQIDR
ncbi:MAG: hypothetical protein HQL56_00955 [Magnetococcales bacterium]|nr:hypothetical protein [Magnetococcales bacterium]